MVVLVTGANGQLGQAIQSIVGNYPLIDFVFCSSSELNITDKNNCETIFEKYKPQFCINSAAIKLPLFAYILNLAACVKQLHVLSSTLIASVNSEGSNLEHPLHRYKITFPPNKKVQINSI